jgi:splicing factor 3B subunit 2
VFHTYLLCLLPDSVS